MAPKVVHCNVIQDSPKVKLLFSLASAQVYGPHSHSIGQTSMSAAIHLDLAHAKDLHETLGPVLKDFPAP